MNRFYTAKVEDRIYSMPLDKMQEFLRVIPNAQLQSTTPVLIYQEDHTSDIIDVPDGEV